MYPLGILFAAGMWLFDTADDCFMNFAYAWAFAHHIRKIYYNLTITGLSVFVTFFIGAIEILGLIGTEYSLSGELWAFMSNSTSTRRFHHRRRVCPDLGRGTSHQALQQIEQKWDPAAASAN